MYSKPMDDNEVVWSETTDGGILKQLFGYFPTMHDARIRSLEIDRPSDRVTMVVDYEDFVGELADRNELSVRIVMEWRRVRAVELTVSENYLMGMELKRNGDLVRADFQTGFGAFGFIEGEGFEARLEKVDPLPDDERQETLTLSYR